MLFNFGDLLIVGGLMFLLGLLIGWRLHPKQVGKAEAHDPADYWKRGEEPPDYGDWNSV